jgi:membrane protein
VELGPSWAWSRVERLNDPDLWTDELAGYGLLRRVGIRLLRVVIAATRASRDRLLNFHAIGLVYTTLLSLVPFLAVAFSVLKAFGVHYRLEPVLARMLEPLGPQGGELTHRIVEFVERMNVGVLGGIGLAGLFYTALSLIDKIEDALNQIWKVRRSRGFRRKFSDYLSVLLVGPVLVFAAFAIIAALRSSWLVQRILQISRLETLTVFLAGHVAPFLLLIAAFTFLYRFLPYARVRLGAAVVGGITTATLWEVVGIGFTALVAGSTSYAAVYSSFAVLIVSFIWLQVAWLVVLIGGQVAYVHQFPSSYAAAYQRYGLLFRERIGLAALIEIARRYLSSQAACRLEELSQVIGAPLSTLEELADGFVERGILVRAIEPEGLMLSRPPEHLGLLEILNAIQDPSRADARTPATRPPAVSEILHRRDEVLREALGQVTLRSLISDTGPQEAAVTDLARYRRS